MWQHLIETALLGVEKKTLDGNQLPPPIKEIMEMAYETPEQQFLSVLAAGHCYLETGLLPQKLTVDPDRSVIDEELPYAPAHISELLNLIEKLPAKLKEPLIGWWMEAIIAQKEILSPDVAIKLLFACNPYHDATKEKVLQVIGKRVEWTMKLNPSLNYKTSDKPPVDWQNGSLHERKEMLRHLLGTDEKKAVDLLASTWGQEPLSHKKAFIELLNQVQEPQEQITEYAQQLYLTEFAYAPKEKKSERDCRQLLAGILLKTPQTNLYRQTESALNNYLTTTKKKSIIGLFSSKNSKSVALPNAPGDGFWNSQSMQQTYGFEPTSFDISNFQTIVQYWFASLMETMPLTHWITNSFDATAEFTCCLLDDPQFQMQVEGKPVPMFLNALTQNALLHHDEALSLQLLSKLPLDKCDPLLGNLGIAQFEQFVKLNNLLADEKVLDACQSAQPHTWSVGFTEQVLKTVYDKAGHNNYINFAALGCAIAKNGHTATLSLLERLNDNASHTVFSNQWRTHIYDPFATVIQLKNSIRTYK